MGKKFLVLAPASPLSVIATPQSEPEEVGDDLMLSGYMMHSESGVGICSDFVNGTFKKDEPGRVALILPGDVVEFHYREAPFAYKYWTVTWVDKNNRAVLKITRAE